MTLPQLNWYGSNRLCSASGSVRTSLLETSARASRNSPQERTKAKVPTATSAGWSSGKTTQRIAPKPPAAIDHRRLLELARDGVDVALEHPDRDRQAERQVGEDECGQRVGEAEVADDDHERHQHRHDRQRLRAEDEQADRRLAAKRRSG